MITLKDKLLMTTEQKLTKTGEWIIKKGRKIVARVYYRPVYFMGKKINYSHPYSVTVRFGEFWGSQEFDTLNEVKHCLNMEGII